MDKKKKIYLIIIAVCIVLAICIGFVVKGKKDLAKKNAEQDKLLLESENTEDDDEDESDEVDDNEVEEASSDDVSSYEELKDAEPLDTKKEDIESKKVDPKKDNFADCQYYIKINNQQNVVTIYKNNNGERTPIKAMTCSIGVSTPKSGIYKIPGTRYVWGVLFGHGPYKNVYGHYTTKIVGNILFHSVPYTRYGDPASLEYDEYNKLGTNASAGCIRLAVVDSKWIYDNIPKGTPVEFYYDSNPGPLGKPATTKIPTNNEKVRDWDPTDSNPSNPWHNPSNLNNSNSNNNSQPSTPTPTPIPSNENNANNNSSNNNNSNNSSTNTNNGNANNNNTSNSNINNSSKNNSNSNSTNTNNNTSVINNSSSNTGTNTVKNNSSTNNTGNISESNNVAIQR